ncbi:MAG TPA: hypothetical protein VGE98_08660, partial [Thermoanaerobaculia bacterium]
MKPLRDIAFRCRALLAALSLAALPLAAQAPAPAATPETWYVVTIGGQAVGSVHEEISAGPVAVEVQSKTHLILNRLDTKVEMSIGETTREAPDGHLLGLDLETRISEQTLTSKITIDGGQARIEATAGGRSFVRMVPLEGALLGPEAIRKLSIERLAKPGDTIEVATWAAEAEAARRVTRTVVGREPVTVDGAQIAALHVRQHTEGNAGESQLWLDAQGHIVQSSDPGPFGEMRTVRASAEAAARTAGGGELPAEVFGGTLIRTAVRLPHPRHLERVVLRLHHREPSLGWPA